LTGEPPLYYLRSPPTRPRSAGSSRSRAGSSSLATPRTNALVEEFAEFEKVYGLKGHDGLLAYPVFESIGNHDLGPEAPIKDKARLRHGGIDYSWDWDDLHLVCLDMYPDVATRVWLARDLARISSGTPLVLFFHYSLEGPWSVPVRRLAAP
jgi:cytolysin (calcineurin-like family phosphatase)